jgi:hypothetical protein
MSSDEDSRPPPPDVTSLRVARALLDGAGAEWVAERFSLSTDEVEAHWQRTVAALTDHYRQKDIAIDDFDSFAKDNIFDVLNLLVTWADYLSRPVYEPGTDDEADDGQDEGKKEGTRPGDAES